MKLNLKKLFHKPLPPPDDTAQTPVLQCSFCRKTQRDVFTLIAGPHVNICDECVGICNSILAERQKDRLAESIRRQRGDPPVAACGLCLRLAPLEEVTAVPERGVLCDPCLEAVRELLHGDQGREP